MIMQGGLRLAVVAAASLAVFVAAQARPASAQLFWDWSGDETVGGSGRQVVGFNPQYSAGQIIVSFGDRKLYYITHPGQAISYPIAVPREQSRWEGVTSVSQKREQPSWTPTPTMLAENPRLPRWVPGGHPMNPLGVRALYLGSSAYRIHGTDAPWTIGTAASKGCIRLYNQDVLDLYPRINVGTKVTVTYQTYTTSPAGAVGMVSNLPKVLPPMPPMPKVLQTMPQVDSPSFFMWGDDDEPVRPARRSRTKAKSAAPSKGAPVQRAKAAAPRPATEQGSDKSEVRPQPELVETASSPAAPPAVPPEQH
jgi:lipoprotein-anchoring transpeptidase ErfK/SrfK